jgi:hypothetical protein
VRHRLMRPFRPEFVQRDSSRPATGAVSVRGPEPLLHSISQALFKSNHAHGHSDVQAPQGKRDPNTKPEVVAHGLSRAYCRRGNVEVGAGTVAFQVAAKVCCDDNPQVIPKDIEGLLATSKCLKETWRRPLRAFQAFGPAK